MQLTNQIRNAIVAHYVEAERAGDTRELCGVVSNDEYVRVANVCEGEDVFKFSKRDQIKWLFGKNKAQAIVHSHTNGNLAPSLKDQQQQIAMDIPWIIVARDHVSGSLEVFMWGGTSVLDQPLEGRQYKHAVTDCFAAARSWFYQEEGKLFPDFPRDVNWWQNGENLFLDHYKELGFRVLDLPADKLKHELKRGDVFLKALGHPTYNHCGVYLGDMTAYHHRVNKLSGQQAIGHYLGKGIKFLRHEDYD